MTPNLDKRLINQGLVFEVIRKWYENNAIGISYRDIEKDLIKGGNKMSLGAVYSACKALEKSGTIVSTKGVARSIRLAKGK